MERCPICNKYNCVYNTADKNYLASRLGVECSGRLSAEQAISVANAIRILIPDATNVKGRAGSLNTGYVSFDLIVTTSTGAKVALDAFFNTWEEYRRIKDLVELAKRS